MSTGLPVAAPFQFTSQPERAGPEAPESEPVFDRRVEPTGRSTTPNGIYQPAPSPALSVPRLPRSAERAPRRRGNRCAPGGDRGDLRVSHGDGDLPPHR